MIDWIFKMIIGAALCAISYTQGYTEGCCESLERQATEYMRKHAPKMYKDFSKGDDQDDAGGVQETAGETEGRLDEDPMPKGRPCLNDERPWLIPSPPAHVQIREKPKMNHDYAHCLDLKKSCPKSCFRAQLTREVEERDDLKGIPLTWTHFKGTDECRRKKNDRKTD